MIKHLYFINTIQSALYSTNKIYLNYMKLIGHKYNYFDVLILFFSQICQKNSLKII